MQARPLEPRYLAGDARHGVLFVHGLGEQPKSDTLLGFGRPLVDWVLRWHEARHERRPEIEWTELGFSPFDPGKTDFQPHARLRMRRLDGRRDTWVLTEAWWAASSLRPNFWTMVRESWVYLGEAVTHTWNAAWLRLKRFWSGKPSSTDPSRLPRLIDFLNTLAAAILYRVAGIVGYVVLLLPLMVLSRIPWPGLQDFILVRLLRPLLQMQLGEFHAFMQDELQAANMRRRVAESIRWLLEEGDCDDVTVIAHSGGAIVSFGALTDAALAEPGAPLGDGRLARVRKLITFGAGLNKAWHLYPELTRMHGPLPSHMHWLDIWTAYDSVPAGPLTPPVDRDGQWVTIFAPSDDVAQRQQPDLDPRVSPDPRAGVSSRAAKQHAAPRRWPVSLEVTNRMIVLVDHGLYWTNDEQFLVRVAAEIDQFCHRDSRFWHGGGELLPEEGRTRALKQAIRARRERVTWLAAVRGLAILAGIGVALAGAVSGLTRPSGALGSFLAAYLLEIGIFQPITAPLDALTDWLRSLAQASMPQLLWLIDAIRALPVILLGALVLNLPLILAYLVFSWRWDEHDAEARHGAVQKIACAGTAQQRCTVAEPEAAPERAEVHTTVRRPE